MRENGRSVERAQARDEEYTIDEEPDYVWCETETLRSDDFSVLLAVICSFALK